MAGKVEIALTSEGKTILQSSTRGESLNKSLNAHEDL